MPPRERGVPAPRSSELPVRCFAGGVGPRWDTGGMCGRYSQAKDPATLAEEFDAIDATEGAWPGPDHNVAPPTTVIAVVDRHPRDADGVPDPARLERSLRPMRWGLVPGWADDPKV